MNRVDHSTAQFLDASRWMSALVVVVSHACALSLVTDAQVQAPGFAVVALSRLENAGHIAVVLFFVVSGYLVGGQELLRILDGQRFDLVRYGIQRFSRIYTVLVPALIATSLLDYAGRRFANGSLLYTDPAFANVGSLAYAIADRDGIGTWLGNLLMLQTVLVEPLGSNGPLWSLANEWWYYSTFALLLVSLSSDRMSAVRLAALAAAVALLAVLPSLMAVWFSIWLLGAGLAVAGRTMRGMPFGLALLLMVAGLVAAVPGTHWTHTLAGEPMVVQIAAKLGMDLLIALAFGVALLSARNAVFRRGARLHRELAGFSFSLYAVHFPLLVFVACVASDRFGIGLSQQLGFPGVLTVVGFVAAIVFYAWCVAAVTERQTPLVRAALTRVLTTRFEEV